MKLLEGKKTYTGIGIVAVGFLVTIGFDEGSAQEMIGQVMEAVGMLVAVYGRAKAKLS